MSREKVEKWKVDQQLLALVLFGADGLPNDSTEDGEAAVKHIQSCSDCKNWLKTRIDTGVYKRHGRINAYCCVMLYVAVEEADEDNVHIMVRWVRGEVLWLIDNGPGKAGYIPISYCPWCGTKLPDESYIADRKGRG